MKWKSKKGEVWDVEDMSNRHLLNAQRYMRRMVKSLADESCACASTIFQGEMAQDCQEHDLNAIADKIMDAVAAVRGFDIEIARRGLTEKPLVEEARI